MEKYFLGSVGRAEAFRKKSDGSLELAFVSKTLTDSGLNISTTKDDIRAGQGAPIQFSFYHDPSVEITLTDVLWKKEYLTAQLGAEFDDTDAEDYISEEIKCNAAGTITVTNDVHELPYNCDVNSKLIVWYTLKGEENWKVGTAVGKVVTGDFVADKYYCVRYLSECSKATVAKINSLIIPEELFLIITAPMFAGDACSASKGKAAGHITFEIPRFQLNGSQEFSMNMSSNQNMSLAGIALAGASDCDDNGGQLLRVIEYKADYVWEEKATKLMSDEEQQVVGKHPAIYAILKDGSVRKCKDAELEMTTDGGTNWIPVADFAAGTYKFRLVNNNSATTENIVIS